MLDKMINWAKRRMWRSRMKKPTSEELITFVKEKWKNQVCPMCGARSWTVSDKMFELREFNDGNLVIGGPNASIIPIVPVTCSNCGNTVMINALSTGLLKKE